MHKILSFFLLFCLIILPGCEQRKAKVKPSGRIIRIGVIAPMSSTDKKSGENTLLGIQTALRMHQYLKNGDRVELLIEDNRGEAKQTLTALEKLHDKEDVVGVLLMAKSDIVLQVVPVADQLQIPILALIATHPDITKNNRFITQLGFDDNYQGTVAALYVRDEMLIDRVAVISDPENAHYTLLADAFIKDFTSSGGDLVAQVLDTHETMDLSKILRQLQNKNIQLLYLAIGPEKVLQLIKEAEKIGWSPRMMGSDGLMTNILLRYKEDSAYFEGMMATDFYSSAQPKTVYGKKAYRIFKKIADGPPTTYSSLGCEGTSLLLNAMDRCGSEINRSCVNTMLRNTKGFEGLFGRIFIRDNGKTERPIFVNEVKNQQMIFLVKVY